MNDPPDWEEQATDILLRMYCAYLEYEGANDPRWHELMRPFLDEARAAGMALAPRPSEFPRERASKIALKVIELVVPRSGVDAPTAFAHIVDVIEAELDRRP